MPKSCCSGVATFNEGGWPTALAENINPSKQLVLELVQGLCKVDGIEAALGVDLLINRVAVELQIDLGKEITQKFLRETT